jgi:hydrogenase maturation protease
MTGAPETVLILGVGNELLGDEGLGIHVARALIVQSLPEHVQVIEAGTALLDLLPEMARHDRVILVDAVRAGREPGTIYRVEMVAGSIRQKEMPLQFSLHEWGILETLQAGETMGLMPKQLELLGAEPEKMELTMELSPRLERAAEQIVDLLVSETGIPAHEAHSSG